MQSEDKLSHRSSRLSTFFRESSMDDSDPLVKQRKESLVPITRSPFKDDESESKRHPGELLVSVSEVPWSDLLLEIAMTTAFASLTDGTPILEASNVTSYLSFFALVWWVWASQVAYNVRFRQSDWLHRLFVFFQVLVFCALATFTNNFDVTNGIADDSHEEKQLAELQMADFASIQDIASQSFRSDRLPTLNVRGISMTMAFSRLLLLVQYLIAFFHAIRKDGRIHIAKRSAFLVHIGTLLFSSLCYFIAFGVIGKDPSKGDQIAKLFLWYVPLLAEVASHFVAVSHYFGGRVRYPAEAIYARSSTVFVIILGGGLDKITNGFQYIVGNVSFGPESIGLILCGVVTFLLLFSLYFGSSEPDRVGSRRALGLFFFQFFYLSAIIVTLQGIAAMLAAGNLGNALETPFDFLRNTEVLMESKGFGMYLNESDYKPSQIHLLEKTGVSLTSLLEWINYGMDMAIDNGTDFNLPYNYLLQADVYVVAQILQNFNSFPDSGSLLQAKMSAFYDNDPSNYTLVNNATFHDLAEDVVVTNATPALWFYAAGGSVLVSLALMTWISQWPRDRYEWGQTVSRLLMGSLIIAFSAIDMNASNNVLDENFAYQGSRIWYLATHSWVLPPYALALLIEQVIELVLLHLAGRGLGDFGSASLNRKFTRVIYARAGTSELDFDPYGNDMQTRRVQDEPESYFDPYAPYDSDKKGFIPIARPVTTFVASPHSGAPTFETQMQYPTRIQGHPPGRTRYTRQGSSESSMQPLVSR